jgi:hypothetical protein
MNLCCFASMVDVSVCVFLSINVLAIVSRLIVHVLAVDVLKNNVDDNEEEEISEGEKHVKNRLILK